jgi:hypothetical protein
MTPATFPLSGDTNMILDIEYVISRHHDGYRVSDWFQGGQETLDAAEIALIAADAERILWDAYLGPDVDGVTVTWRITKADTGTATTGTYTSRNAADDTFSICTLTAVRKADGWCVEDSCGGVWWPSDDAADEIQLAVCPAAAVFAMCQNSPMRGEWHS